MIDTSAGSGETANDIICHDNVVYGVNTQTNTLTTTGVLPSSLQEHEYDYPLHDISEPLPSVYERVDENDDELAVNVNVSYATVPNQWDRLVIMMSTCGNVHMQFFLSVEYNYTYQLSLDISS